MARERRPMVRAVQTVVEIDAGQAMRATGNGDPLAQTWLIRQLQASLWLPDGLDAAERAGRIRAALAMLEGIAPRDGAEGLLAVQMAATHNAALDCLRRAAAGQSFEEREQSLRHAARLLDVYLRQVEALDRYRGKSPPRVTVENVNVGAGGRAIVGAVAHGDAPALPAQG